MAVFYTCVFDVCIFLIMTQYFIAVFMNYRCLKNVAHLILYNLNKLEPVIVILARNILIILASKRICSFTSNLTITCFTLQFFTVAEMTYFHTSLLCL